MNEETEEFKSLFLCRLGAKPQPGWLSFVHPSIPGCRILLVALRVIRLFGVTDTFIGLRERTIGDRTVSRTSPIYSAISCMRQEIWPIAALQLSPHRHAGQAIIQLDVTISDHCGLTGARLIGGRFVSEVFTAEITAAFCQRPSHLPAGTYSVVGDHIVMILSMAEITATSARGSRTPSKTLWLPKLPLSTTTMMCDSGSSGYAARARSTEAPGAEWLSSLYAEEPALFALSGERRLPRPKHSRDTPPDPTSLTAPSPAIGAGLGSGKPSW
ncbi:hypothetical protein RF11_05190 [Thelohanellus kitauei]|uniref:Uncharacterized protein n=1 Tax=Thelohanellus kitauei TaxID=669202 RepID=A0A0C2IUZ9_THEKT|nr:hypothetical protein RF11_05190 [Thelohanellus kitauei]